MSGIVYFFFYILIFIPFRILLPTKVINKKNKVKKGPVIFVCNHLSGFDPFIICTRVRPRMFGLAKKEWFKNWFLRGFFKMCGAYPVDRGKADVGAIKFVLGKLKKGKTILLFPEGTRNRENEDLQQVKNGVILFHAKSGAPILPMTLAKKPKPFRRNKLIIGEPLYLDFANSAKPSKEELAAGAERLSTVMAELLEKVRQGK